MRLIDVDSTCSSGTTLANKHDSLGEKKSRALADPYASLSSSLLALHTDRQTSHVWNNQLKRDLNLEKKIFQRTEQIHMGTCAGDTPEIQVKPAISLRKSRFLKGLGNMLAKQPPKFCFKLEAQSACTTLYVASELHHTKETNCTQLNTHREIKDIPHSAALHDSNI